ncbi:hypothetical protein IFM89_038493 [Coptis chinensis]|uniref:Protein RIK n=1 Tax=Coptis chinensis TaxID=261450 RepID=A0A835IZM6_9MAGN|nr:hypothetical protein IFM89_038493 [Coptis chinensis]
MAENSRPKVSEELTATTTSAKQRKRRKWDEPAEYFISAAPFTANIPQKINLVIYFYFFTSIFMVYFNFYGLLLQQKIQDELIAREIVINDAESTVRYKLTKRQTQDEIQRCTGAVVITRGKYRPPNVLPDSEKPLYLHISAGSHLKETAERIIAVDHAAAMVEEMLKQGQNSHPTSIPFHSTTNVGGQVSHPFNACVFLGFDTDPSLNIGSRIRGPNDQYINHIMNETGATVILRGRGSGNLESLDCEDFQQPLHLFLSCNNPKSVEDAKLLAENLLDTIAAECGASRVSSSKVYKAVPPPPQLMAGVHSSGIDQRVSSVTVPSMASPTISSTLVTPVSSVVLPGVNGTFPQSAVSQSGGLLGYGQPQPNTVSYTQPSVGGTSYSGYGGIYPQATPLQQVAFVLKQSSPPVMSVIPPATSAGNTTTKLNSSSSFGSEKLAPQKRKFQELPIASKIPAERQQNLLQKSEFVKPGPPLEDSSFRNISYIPPPKKLVHTSSTVMPPPPPRTMPPPPSRTVPPPPLKLMSSTPFSEAGHSISNPTKSTSDPVPDTLIKLMEYGDDDEDLEEESQKSNVKPISVPKPFWAL